MMINTGYDKHVTKYRVVTEGDSIYIERCDKKLGWHRLPRGRTYIWRFPMGSPDSETSVEGAYLYDTVEEAIEDLQKLERHIKAVEKKRRRAKKVEFETEF